ncbi:MAG TPA: EAL domain-containing protein [Allosphingosinicella sp.]|jgi:diguanylate cyclase (GGDEF)-like protein|uniref:putative bifunctional diguanylate cyclase/phosphodiesterase n=1 Tax=Allosphingosinicella sp. TaxID=2823234 RepID=UPI002F277634
MFSRDETTRSGRDDFVIIGVAVSVLLVLAALGNGYFELAKVLFARLGASNSQIITGLLLLNVALTIYGWRLYRDARREVTVRTAAEKRAQSLASTDPLTGFLNRRSLVEAVEELLGAADKRRRAVAMLIIDLDGFKTINDVHGHLTGDNLLRTTAEVIRKALPNDAISARLGGDEFAAAFLFDPDMPVTVDGVADYIVDRLGKPFDLAGVHTHISASLGIARSDQDCASVEALLRRADIAMYAAKKLGRGRAVWFDASMERELQNRNAIEAGLRRGIPEGEFVPFFEQQIDLLTGSLHGFEMLARWKHPTRGIVPPDEFIGVAEECGLISDLSLSVMRQAFEEARGWDSSLTLSVNISPSQLKDPWLAQRLVKLLVETGFPAERLEVEITESSLFENLGLAQSIVGSLKNQGIRLALDDFGTGYSSLAHLRALPFDRIKIDRSFVSSINDNPESAAIVNAITRLADSLNLAVTAEGIEDELVEARLRSIGQYKAQGWLFGRPIPIPEVRKLLADKGLLPVTREVQPSQQRIARTG